MRPEIARFIVSNGGDPSSMTEQKWEDVLVAALQEIDALQESVIALIRTREELLGKAQLLSHAALRAGARRTCSTSSSSIK